MTNFTLVEKGGYTLLETPVLAAYWGVIRGLLAEQPDLQAALDGRQPANANLTAIAALETDAFGRSLLTKTNGSDVRSYIGAGTSNFDGQFSSLGGKPSTIAGYGITDFNSLGDERWQAWSAGLNSLAVGIDNGGISLNDRIWYQLADQTWSPITIGSGLSFTAGTLSSTSGSAYNVTTDPIWTAKGGLLAGSGASSASVLDVGANGKLLKANSAAGTGLEWALLVAGDIPDLSATYQLKADGLTSWAGITRAAGFDSFVATPSSANFRALLTDKTGSGVAVFATSPTLVTPTLGAAIATSVAFGGGGSITGTAGSVSLTASGTNQNVTLTPSGTGINSFGGGRSEVTGGFRVTGVLDPTSGAGLEFQYSAGVSRMQSYDRTTAAWKPLAFRGSVCTFQFAATDSFQTMAAGIALGSSFSVGLINSGGLLEVNNGAAGQWASVKLGARDSGTTTVADGLTIGHQSTGTPGTGLGSAVLFNINSSTTADQNAMRLRTEWTTATHATRTSKFVVALVNSASALTDVFTVNGDGSATLTGALTVTAVVNAFSFVSTAAGVSQLDLNISDGVGVIGALRKSQSANSLGGYLQFYGGDSGATSRGFVGFTHRGIGSDSIFTGEDADSIAIRAANSLILGGGGDKMAAKFDGSTTAGDTRLLLWDVTAGSFKRVTIGAADSGGSGFKVLRVTN